MRITPPPSITTFFSVNFLLDENDISRGVTFTTTAQETVPCYSHFY